MSVKLKPITETAWLVINDTDDTRVGLLTEIRNQYILMVAGAKQQFLNRKEVNKFFNEDIFVSVPIEPPKEPEVKKDYFVNGYPVDFDNPSEVLVKGNKLPLFSKKSTSDVYYSAGHYCLNFPKNWMPAYCPKLSTLETYEYAGPFKTEIEMRAMLTNLRKDKNLKK
jgi:hypothetical protein